MKPTQILRERIRRLPLTTKQARKGFYKGTGTKILGHWDPLNPRKFVPDWEKIRTYKFPEFGLADFRLTPFVAGKIGTYEAVGHNQWRVPEKKMTGEQYLQQWIEETGGFDRLDLYPEAEEEAQSEEGKK
ncbi:uncharacterized protein EI97DRAFT_435463 [Westerdykella ornata]|uniref:50S ribosomal protein YmL27 n=1 Tax=Westerdykella ornata TaxID=318751 RepID=A0A6A6JC06_WESOR|nr:uncharacterized protein EI97DRAFT_435463 [Westerdykella ornata]KAF2274101.1 hypothetical protein EI97DRAFT_435463 [Westerdykella ornata]